jgi:hypothetical protein
MKMEQTQCSETLAFKLQTLMNHPEESVQQLLRVFDSDGLTTLLVSRYFM